MSPSSVAGWICFIKISYVSVQSAGAAVLALLLSSGGGSLVAAVAVVVVAAKYPLLKCF